MSTRIGLGRHARIDAAAGDPLEGLVNLFDLGIVLAIAFLVGGVSLMLAHASRSPRRGPDDNQPSALHTRTLPSTAAAPAATGRGHPVGTVYRLTDGRLVFVPRAGR
jgi:hypothetical protein